jgi:hypothetical protein
MRVRDGATVEVKVNGTLYNVTRKAVIDAVAGKPPGHAGSLFVEVQGRLYPIKQPLAEALSLRMSDVRSDLATQRLQQLGFKVLRV